MKHFLTAWPHVVRSLKESHILLCLDFDGTLAPIARKPSEVLLSAGIREVLKKLKGKDWCTIAVISGRTLRSLIGKVRLEGIIYGGNHGAQLTGPNIDFQAPISPEAYRAFEAIRSNVRSLTAAIKGVVIEDKTYSLSIHFREVEEADVPRLTRTISRTVRPLIDDGYVRMSAGKKVFDITPSSWNKGKAVQWLLRHLSLTTMSQSVVPIYVGDDTTDEDAFAAIGQNGFTVVVGTSRRSAAQYFLRDTYEVIKLLEKMLLLRDQ
jgi:trehalose 6-phosphate phosphatase